MSIRRCKASTDIGWWQCHLCMSHKGNHISWDDRDAVWQEWTETIYYERQDPIIQEKLTAAKIERSDGPKASR